MDPIPTDPGRAFRRGLAAGAVLGGAVAFAVALTMLRPGPEKAPPPDEALPRATRALKDPLAPRSAPDRFGDGPAGSPSLFPRDR